MRKLRSRSPFEEEDAVDEVLEHARAGNGALLGHVPDEDHRGVDALCNLEDRVRGLAHLPDRTGRARHSLRMEGLDRVDDTRIRPLGLERGQDVLQGRLGDDRHAESALAKALRAHPDLRGRLLAGHVEGAAAGSRHVAQRHPRERRLADARRAA